MPTGMQIKVFVGDPTLVETSVNAFIATSGIDLVGISYQYEQGSPRLIAVVHYVPPAASP